MTPISTEALQRFIVTQRWFGSKTREVAELDVLESIRLSEGEDPELHLAIVEVRFQPGTHELYQLPIGTRPVDDNWTHGVICAEEERVSYDAMADPELVRVLAKLMREDAEIETAQGVAEFRALDGCDALQGEHVRALGAEQSNSSVVLDERFVLKAFRRLGPGVNPELEVLRFLTDRGFPHIAALRGYYAHTGGQLDTTLGVVQDYVAGSVDGWDLALEDLRSEDPMRFVARAESLGEVTGSLHAALASDNADEAFAPAETSAESLSLLTATVDEEIERMFRDLPEDLPELEPIRGRGEEIRDGLRALTQVGSAGRVIRHHGDYHLGQVLLDDGRWVILDFEGEPARSVVERRGKRSPLRDVAGMLRSFAYAATASRLLHDAPAPEGWEQAARDAFLTGYLRTTDQSLLPPGHAAIERLLSVFELEKAVYELRYELDHRPDWVSIPVAGIVRLLELQAEGVA
jgi:trehalose synthase-fused probable maltokinase